MKTALITGASRGIGTACAIALAKSGYNIVLNYNKSEEKALTLSKIIADNYLVDVMCIKADVALISFSIFIASKIRRTSPFLTA